MPELDFCDTTELERLTGRKRPRAQCEALRSMKIPFITDADGHPLVLRSNVLAKFGVIAASEKAKERPTPNLAGAFDSIRQRRAS